MGKYEPLRDYLAVCAGDQEQMRFGQVEQLVGPLPDSAREHRACAGRRRDAQADLDQSRPDQPRRRAAPSLGQPAPARMREVTPGGT